MDTLKARVANGRLVLDVPCELPEGTELELVVADPGDDLDDAERQALHSALDRAWEGVKAGDKLIPAERFVEELRKR